MPPVDLPPVHLVLFGGSRGTGFAVARLARQRAWPVTAMVRPGSPSEALADLGCAVVAGDALQAADVAATIDKAGRDAVAVSTLGGGVTGRSADFQGNANVVDALVRAGLRRLVLVSSLGAGDSRTHASARLLAAIGPVLEKKTRAEAYAVEAGLDLTILRPGGLLSGAPSGRARLIEDAAVHGWIDRADLAALILHCLEDANTVGRTLSAVDPDAAPSAKGGRT